MANKAKSVDSLGHRFSADRPLVIMIKSSGTGYQIDPNDLFVGERGVEFIDLRSEYNMFVPWENIANISQRVEEKADGEND